MTVTEPKLLPVELIAEIISFVADGHLSKWDRRCPSIFSTLAAGSLVSRTWNTICRSHIFHTVRIIQFGDTVDSLSFLHLQAPHLSEYVRKLYLKWDARCTAADWVPECFGRLKNLYELHLDAWFPHPVALAPLASGIASLLAAPRLRKLAFRDCCFAADASDLLSMLPATIEELILEDIDSLDLLLDNIVAPDSKMNAPSNNSKCLVYLRSMDALYLYHPMLKLKAFIECPNLERLCVGLNGSEPWDLPPWIPASLSELELRVGLDNRIPGFGTAIQPSAVTIDLSAGSLASYYEAFTWIKDCINRLPSPRSIRALTISIMNQHYIPDDDLDGLYPKLSDYAMFSQFLQQLRVCEHGNLKKITLNVTMKVGVNDSTDVNELRADEGRELANLEKGLSELLRANVLDVDFTLKRMLGLGDDGVSELSETLVHSSIHARGL